MFTIQKFATNPRLTNTVQVTFKTVRYDHYSNIALLISELSTPLKKNTGEQLIATHFVKLYSSRGILINRLVCFSKNYSNLRLIICTVVNRNVFVLILFIQLTFRGLSVPQKKHTPTPILFEVDQSTKYKNCNTVPTTSARIEPSGPFSLC